jgi:phosphate starvation-inducible protein PhoH
MKNNTVQNIMEDEKYLENEKVNLLSGHSIQNEDKKPIYFSNQLQEGKSNILASIMNLTLGCLGAGKLYFSIKKSKEF